MINPGFNAFLGLFLNLFFAFYIWKLIQFVDFKKVFFSKTPDNAIKFLALFMTFGLAYLASSFFMTLITEIQNIIYSIS